MSSTVNPKKFRNAVGGYNKEDVNNYIIEADLAFHAQTESLNETITTLRDQNEALTKDLEAAAARGKETEQSAAETAAKLAAKETDYAELEKQFQEIQKRIDICLAQTEAQNIVIEKLRGENSNLSAKLESAERSLAEAETKSAAYKETAENAQAQADALRAEMDRAVIREKELAAAELEQYKAALSADEDSIAYKLQMYDQLSGQIGDILLGANRNADEILASAKAEAERLQQEAEEEAQSGRRQWQSDLLKIRTETENAAENIRNDLNIAAARILEEITRDIRLNTDNCVKEITTCISELEYDTDTLLQTLQKRYLEMGERIQYYQACAQESIAGRVAELEARRPNVSALGSRE